MSDPNPNLKLVVVFESANPIALDLAQAALSEAGIDFALSPPATPEFGFTPILSPASRILVAEQLAPAARQVVEGALPGEPQEADMDQTE